MSDKIPSSEGAGSAKKNIAEVASLAMTKASTPMEGAGIEQVQDATMEDVMGQNEDLLAQLLNTSEAMDIEGGGEGGRRRRRRRGRGRGRRVRRREKEKSPSQRGRRAQPASRKLPRWKWTPLP